MRHYHVNSWLWCTHTHPLEGKMALLDPIMNVWNDLEECPWLEWLFYFDILRVRHILIEELCKLIWLFLERFLILKWWRRFCVISEKSWNGNRIKSSQFFGPCSAPMHFAPRVRNVIDFVKLKISEKTNRLSIETRTWNSIIGFQLKKKWLVGYVFQIIVQNQTSKL